MKNSMKSISNLNNSDIEWTWCQDITILDIIILKLDGIILEIFYQGIKN